LGLSASQVAVVMCIAHFGMAAGAPLGGILADNAGRLPAVAFCYVTMICGAVLMGVAGSFLALLIGRIVEAVGMGASLCVITTYMTEVSPTAIRGQLPSLEEPLINVGYLIACLVSWAFASAPGGWRWMLGLGAALPALMLLPVVLRLPPESPRFLLARGRAAEAAAELATLVDQREATETLSAWAADDPPPEARWSQVLLAEDPAVRRSLVAGVGVMCLQMLSGNSIVMVYPTEIMAQEMGTRAASLCTVLMAVSRLVAVLPIVFMIDHIGRRRLLLWSSVGVALACCFTGWFYMAGTQLLPLKFCSFLLFSICYCVGLGPVTWVYTGEVMDTSVRSKGMSLAMTTARLCGAGLLLVYPRISSCIGIGPFFLILAALNFAGWGFMAVAVPETKGTTLEDMRKHFRGDRCR